MNDDRLLSLKYWRELLSRRRLLVITTILGVVALAASFSVIQAPLFEATCRLYVNRQKVQAMSMEELYAKQNVRPNDVVATQMEMLVSTPVLESAVRDLEARGVLSFDDAPAKRQAGGLGAWLRRVTTPEQKRRPAERRARYVDSLKKRISIMPSGGNAFLMVSVRHRHPRLAAAIANAVATAHLRADREMLRRSADEAAAWLSAKVRDQREKLVSAEQRLREYGGPSPTEDMSVLAVQEMGRLQQALLDVRMRILQAEEQQSGSRADRRQAAEAVDDQVKGELRERIRKELVESGVTLAGLRQKYGERHPDVLAEAEKEKSLREELVRLGPGSALGLAMPGGGALAGLDLDALRAQERMLRSLQAGVAGGTDGTRYAVLKREVDINRSLYNEMLARLNEITIAAGIDSSNAEIFEPARPPDVPVAPNVPKNLALGLLGGLFLGLGGAAVRDQLDQSLRDPGQANDLLRAPVLGLIPFHKKALPSAIDIPRVFVVGAEAESAPAEAYRILRAHIAGTLAEKEARVLVFTSAVPGEGKSTTAANLAAAFAENAQRVLLVDGDMRRPSLSRFFKVDPKKSVARTLRGECAPAEEVQWSGVANLDILACRPGATAPDGERFKESLRGLFSWARDRYDRVIVDMPIAMVVPGVTEAAQAGGSILLVHRPGWVPSQVLEQVREHLALSRANLVGVVLNGVRARWVGARYALLPYYASSYRPVRAVAAE